MSPREKQAKQIADNLSSAIFEMIMFNNPAPEPSTESEISHKDLANLANVTTETVIRWINQKQLVGRRESARIYKINWADWERFAVGKGLDPDGNNQ